MSPRRTARVGGRVEELKSLVLSQSNRASRSMITAFDCDNDAWYLQDGATVYILINVLRMHISCLAW